MDHNKVPCNYSPHMLRPVLAWDYLCSLCLLLRQARMSLADIYLFFSLPRDQLANYNTKGAKKRRLI